MAEASRSAIPFISANVLNTDINVEQYKDGLARLEALNAELFSV